jgi:hypothetical protein
MLPLCGIFCRKFLIKTCLQAYLFYCMVVHFDATSVLPIIFVAKLRIMRNYKYEELPLFLIVETSMLSLLVHYFLVPKLRSLFHASGTPK